MTCVQSADGYSLSSNDNIIYRCTGLCVAAVLQLQVNAIAKCMNGRAQKTERYDRQGQLQMASCAV